MHFKCADADILLNGEFASAQGEQSGDVDTIIDLKPLDFTVCTSAVAYVHHYSRFGIN